MKSRNLWRSRSAIALASISLILLLSLATINDALAQMQIGKQKGKKERFRWGIKAAKKNGNNFTIATEMFTVRFAGRQGGSPRFKFWHNAENGSVYQVFFHQIFEFNDTNGDGTFNRTEDKKLPGQMFALSSAKLLLNGPVNITDEETDEVVGVSFNFTISGRKGNRRLKDASIIFQCSLFEQDYSMSSEGISYNVTGGAELKIDVIIESWPFKDDDNMLCLRWSINRQDMNLEPSVSENRVTFGRGYFSWVSEASVYNETDSETVPVTGSFNMTGKTVNVYLAYPNFQNKSLIHDPSIGVMAPLQLSPQLSSNAASLGETATLSATVTDDWNNPITGAEISASIDGAIITLSDQGDGSYQAALDTLSLGEGVFDVVVAAEKDGYTLSQETLTLNVQSAIQWVTYALTGSAVVALALTGALALKERKREEGRQR
ncbi:MAG: Ig-like domain-containing protein [Candidatus Bathyarchaeota archaeon]|nr:Ig-like domain-containing protein [Candidatus Bathyarchaeota archaeon]